MSWFYKYFLCGGFGLFFFPHSGRANWGHSSVFPSCKAHEGQPHCSQCRVPVLELDLLFTSLIKPSDLDLLSGSACTCECRAWGKQMNRKSSCSVVLSYQEYKTCKREISFARVCLLYLKQRLIHFKPGLMLLYPDVPKLSEGSFLLCQVIS